MTSITISSLRHGHDLSLVLNWLQGSGWQWVHLRQATAAVPPCGKTLADRRALPTLVTAILVSYNNTTVYRCLCAAALD